MKFSKAYEKFKAREDYDDLPIKERVEKARKYGDSLAFMALIVECAKAGHNRKEISLGKQKALKCEDCGLVK